MSNPFDYINSVSHLKKDMMRGTDNDELSEKEYKPFLANRSLSFHADSILYSNEMNRLGHLDNLLQYDFYMNSLRSRKRFSKWMKPEESENVDIIREVYKCNLKKAIDASRILTKEHIKSLKESLYTGGMKK
tara:strand:- start:1600 stop:1995 length:396 start_codon:yes stop_codon:yes gene_type:complete